MRFGKILKKPLLKGNENSLDIYKISENTKIIYNGKRDIEIKNKPSLELKAINNDIVFYSFDDNSNCFFNNYDLKNQYFKIQYRLKDFSGNNLINGYCQ